jgi:hypothetical protein
MLRILDCHLGKFKAATMTQVKRYLSRRKTARRMPEYSGYSTTRRANAVDVEEISWNAEETARWLALLTNREGELKELLAKEQPDGGIADLYSAPGMIQLMVGMALVFGEPAVNTADSPADEAQLPEQPARESVPVPTCP